jgi:RNA polymerase sigma factor (sigma-70 family)
MYNTLNNLEQPVGKWAAVSPPPEMIKVLLQGVPRMPPTPELKLYSAILKKPPVDYREPLVVIFSYLYPSQEISKNYRESCCSWVTALLQDAVSYDTELIKGSLSQLLMKLPERLQRVIRLRFGLDSQRRQTLEQISREFGLSKERIRQLESQALHKLRHPSWSRALRQVVLGEYLQTRLREELQNCRGRLSISQIWPEGLAELMAWRRSPQVALSTVGVQE